MQQSASRSEIRRYIRNRRNQLTPQQQRQASDALLQRVITLSEIRSARSVALYLANDGELDPMPVIQWAWKQKITTCIPVLHPFSEGQLLFLRYTPESQMVRNRYGIPEPRLRTQDIIPVAGLDIIFTPLVAFDTLGHRLGMGGGYYDRTLTPFAGQSVPQAIGLAHDCQQLIQLPRKSWDVPLNKIITPSKTWSWNH